MSRDDPESGLEELARRGQVKERERVPGGMAVKPERTVWKSRVESRDL